MGCPSLDFLQLIDVLILQLIDVLIDGVLEAAPYHGDIGKPFELMQTSSQVAFDKSQLKLSGSLGSRVCVCGAPMTGSAQGTSETLAFDQKVAHLI